MAEETTYTMYQLIITLFKYLGLGAIIMVVVKEILSYLNLRRYSVQGIKTRYYPIIGYSFTLVKGSMTNDVMKYLKEDSKFSKQSFIAYNNQRGTTINVVLLGADVVKEFSQIESSVTIKFSNVDYKLMGFTLMSGEKAMKERALFAQVFNYKNLEKFCPILYKTINLRLDFIEKLIKNSPTKSIQMDVKAELYNDLIKDMSLQILLGSSEDVKDKEGSSFFDLVNDLLQSEINILFLSPINDMFNGLIEKLGIHPDLIKIKKYKKKIKDIIMREYHQREEAEVVKDRISFIDIVIKHNKKMDAEGTPENKMQEDEFLGNIEIFQAAASDTSFNSSSALPVLLAKNPEAKKKLIEEIAGLKESQLEELTLDTVDTLKYLDACVKEQLRYIPPIAITASRRAVKDFVLAGKKIYKGDQINYSPVNLHHSEEYFENPEKYDPERFYQKKPNVRYSYLPFATGPRVCVGMHFGEMVIKLANLALFRRFDVEIVEGFEYKKIISPLQGFENCNLILRELKK